MHVIVCICVREFRDEILLRGGGGGDVKPRKIRISEKKKKKGNMVISVKIQNFSRSRMKTRITPLSSSREI